LAVVVVVTMVTVVMMVAMLGLVHDGAPLQVDAAPREPTLTGD
jgi:hypothetical protein